MKKDIESASYPDESWLGKYSIEINNLLTELNK